MWSKLKTNQHKNPQFCIKCHNYKPPTSFSHNKTNICKKCEKEQIRRGECMEMRIGNK